MAHCRKLHFRIWVIGMMLTMSLSLVVQHTSVGQGSDYSKITLYDVTQKEFVSIQDLMGKKGVVLVFTGSYCPYIDYYEDRLYDLKNEFTPLGVEFVLINSNNSVGDQTETIAQMRAESKSSSYRIISDQSHAVMEAFGATKTPEVIVLKYKNNQIVKAYQGAIDDNPKSESMVKKDFLKLVLNNLITNSPRVVKDTRPVGCLIK